MHHWQNVNTNDGSVCVGHTKLIGSLCWQLRRGCLWNKGALLLWPLHLCHFLHCLSDCCGFQHCIFQVAFTSEAGPQEHNLKCSKIACRFCCLTLADSNWSRFSQHRVSFYLLVFGIALSVTATIVYEMAKSPHGLYVMELCTAPTTHFSVILNEYNGYEKVYNGDNIVQIAGILIKQFELVIYALIFRQSIFCVLIGRSLRVRYVMYLKIKFYCNNVRRCVGEIHLT